jgi:hypothetical protein
MLIIFKELKQKFKSLLKISVCKEIWVQWNDLLDVKQKKKNQKPK